MRLNSLTLGFAILMAAMSPVRAATISHTYTFSASAGGPFDPFVGSFSLTFDNSADISDISTGTTAGITLLTQPAGFTLGSPLAFFYTKASDSIGIGGLNAGVFSLVPG